MSNFVVSVKDVSENGTWSAIASTSQRDRDGERIMPGAFEPLPRDVVVCDTHGGTPIGRAVPSYDYADRLVLEGRFASTAKAQEMRALVREGIVDSMSVVFLRGDSSFVDGTRITTKGTLLGVDFVTVPSNPGALVLASRAYSGTTAKTCRAIAADSVSFLAQVHLAESRALLADLGPSTAPGDVRRWLHGLLRGL